MHIHHQSIFISRAVSILFTLIIIGLFYYVLLNWHGANIALLGTVLFVTSSWFLHFARQATPDILTLSLLATLAYGTWLRKTRRSALVILFGVAIAVGLVYIPGLLWFVIVGGIWQRKSILEPTKNAKLSFFPIVLLGGLLLVPLILALVRQPALIKTLIGLPAQLPKPYDYLRHTLNVPYQIFFKGPDAPVLWLGRLPLLDLFTAVMSLLGVFAYYKKLKLDRTRMLFGTLLIGTLLVGLRGPVSIIVLMPYLYFLATAGIAYMLNQWYSVYPRNPLARSLGYGLIIIAIFLASYYNLRNYFVAWPNTPATKQAYHLRS